MTVRLWTDGSSDAGAAVAGRSGGAGEGRELGRMGRHTEFVTGVDWCLFGAEGWAASCGWDQRVCVFDAGALVG